MVKIQQKKRLGGRPCKYPWEDWFHSILTKGWLVLKSSKDFTCDSYMMRQMVIIKANKRKVKIHSEVIENTVRISLIRELTDNAAPKGAKLMCFYSWECKNRLGKIRRPETQKTE